MTVLLTILKIIGWIILILLLILLALVLLILFVPVTYRAEASCRKELTAKVRASWMFGLANLHISYQDKELLMYLRIFGVKKRLMGGEAAAVGEELKEDMEEAFSDSEFVADVEKAAGESNLEQAKDEAQEAGNEITGKVRQEPGDPEASAEENNSRPHKKHRLRELFSRIRSIFRQIRGMIKNIRITVTKGKKLLTDQRNQQAFSHLKDELFYLLRILMPTKMKLTAQFSTGEPDTTGQVLGILAMFPIGYQNRWNITPDFTAEEFYLEGDTDIRGHVFPVQVVRMLIRILMDKNCRRLYAQIESFSHT